MLTPRKVKYRKSQKGVIPDRASRKTNLAFGDYGLKALGSGRISARQIEAARRAMTRFVARGGKIWIRIFPDKPITKKGAEVPMGGGKGSVDHFAAVVGAGAIMFEMGGVEKSIAQEAMKLAAYKLPVKTKFIAK